MQPGSLCGVLPCLRDGSTNMCIFQGARRVPSLEPNGGSECAQFYRCSRAEGRWDGGRNDAGKPIDTLVCDLSNFYVLSFRTATKHLAECFASGCSSSVSNVLAMA